MKKKVGLFFGSYNPVHIGHLILASFIEQYSDLEEIWLVVTPQSPFKKKSSLLDNHHRLEMVYMACGDHEKLRPSDAEFALPQPNYTVNTLAHLEEKHPHLEFALIMGEDNLKSFHKWKNYEVILDRHEIYVYPRISSGQIKTGFDEHPHIKRVQAPIMEISASFIRKAISEGKDVRLMLPEKVWKYIDHMNFYK